MASYYSGSNSDASPVSQSDHSSTESQFGELLEQRTQQQPYTTYANVKKSLENRHLALQEGKTCDQYLVFTSTPSEQWSKLSCDQSSVSKYCRFSFNPKTEILIAKVMPGLAHEFVIRKFDIIFFLELAATGIHEEVQPAGSQTTTIGNWKKEADCSWGLPTAEGRLLTFVVEVGLSESMSRLAIDAHGWLESNGSSVKVVVTIALKRSTPEIIIERWELGTRGHRVTTRSSPLTAYRTARLQLSRTNHTTTIAGESFLNGTSTPITYLTLPFEKIVGRTPRAPLERDFLISEQTLRKFAEAVWRDQGL